MLGHPIPPNVIVLLTCTLISNNLFLGSSMVWVTSCFLTNYEFHYRGIHSYHCEYTEKKFYLLLYCII